jgi:hypothetical protein
MADDANRGQIVLNSHADVFQIFLDAFLVHRFEQRVPDSGLESPEITRHLLLSFFRSFVCKVFFLNL